MHVFWDLDFKWIRAAGGDEKQKVNASRVFCRNYSTMSKNASKNRVLSVPKAAKNDQDAPKVAKKCVRASKNEKKCGQKRKICQHGPNMDNSKARFLKVPLPSKEMQYVNPRV